MADYPTAVTSFVAKTDFTDSVLAAHVNKLQDELYAVQVELGTSPSGASATVAARAAALESSKFAAGSTILAALGSVGAPGLSFSGAATMGLYQSAAGVLGVATAGAARMTVSSSEVLLTPPLTVQAGSVSAPGLRFTGSTGTGAYLPTVGVGALSAAGTQSMLWDVNSIGVRGGTVSLPGLRFIGDPDTGMYSDGADAGKLAAGGSQAMLWDSKSIGINAGSETEPGLRFVGDGNTGIYSSAGGAINFTANSKPIIQFGQAHVLMESGVQLRADAGTLALPGLTFRNDSNTGLYSSADNVIAFSIAGTQRANLSAAGLAVTGSVDASTHVEGTRFICSGFGTAALPSFRPGTDADTGMYADAGSVIKWSIASAMKLKLNSAGLDVTGTTVSSGDVTAPRFLADSASTAALPSIRPGTDNDTGMYADAGAVIQWSIAGTKSMQLNAAELAVERLTSLSGSLLINTAGGGLVLDASGANDLSFQTNGTTRGYYDNSLNAWRFHSGTTETVKISASNLIMVPAAGQILAQDGTDGAPGIAFNSDPDTGIYRQATGVVGIAGGGVTQVLTTATYLVLGADQPNGTTTELRFRNSGDERIIHDDIANNFDFYEDGTIAASTLRSGAFDVVSDPKTKQNMRPATGDALTALKKLDVLEYEVEGKPTEGVPLVVTRRGVTTTNVREAFGANTPLVQDASGGGGGEVESLSLYGLLAEVVRSVQELAAEVDELKARPHRGTP